MNTDEDVIDELNNEHPYSTSEKDLEPIHNGEKLKWDHPAGIVGKKIGSPAIYSCELCHLPIIIYGRLMPCKHTFCFSCSFNLENVYCIRCNTKVDTIEKISLGMVFLCKEMTSQAKICNTSYLSSQELLNHSKNHKIESTTPISNISSDLKSKNNILDNLFSTLTSQSLINNELLIKNKKVTSSSLILSNLKCSIQNEYQYKNKLPDHNDNKQNNLNLSTYKNDYIYEKSKSNSLRSKNLYAPSESTLFYVSSALNNNNNQQLSKRKRNSFSISQQESGFKKPSNISYKNKIPTTLINSSEGYYEYNTKAKTYDLNISTIKPHSSQMLVTNVYETPKVLSFNSPLIKKNCSISQSTSHFKTTQKCSGNLTNLNKIVKHSNPLLHDIFNNMVPPPPPPIFPNMKNCESNLMVSNQIEPTIYTDYNINLIYNKSYPDINHSGDISPSVKYSSNHNLNIQSCINTSTKNDQSFNTNSMFHQILCAPPPPPPEPSYSSCDYNRIPKSLYKNVDPAALLLLNLSASGHLDEEISNMDFMRISGNDKESLESINMIMSPVPHSVFEYIDDHHGNLNLCLPHSSNNTFTHVINNQNTNIYNSTSSCIPYNVLNSQPYFPINISNNGRNKSNSIDISDRLNSNTLIASNLKENSLFYSHYPGMYSPKSNTYLHNFSSQSNINISSQNCNTDSFKNLPSCDYTNKQNYHEKLTGSLSNFEVAMNSVDGIRRMASDMFNSMNSTNKNAKDIDQCNILPPSDNPGPSNINYANQLIPPPMFDQITQNSNNYMNSFVNQHSQMDNSIGNASSISPNAFPYVPFPYSSLVNKLTHNPELNLTTDPSVPFHYPYKILPPGISAKHYSPFNAMSPHHFPPPSPFSPPSSANMTHNSNHYSQHLHKIPHYSMLTPFMSSQTSLPLSQITPLPVHSFTDHSKYLNNNNPNS
ncbi:unnamed protein product [Gordionus sp. m RMFG-2023]